ncbi:putative ABC transport system ATP-binding protein [Thermocatellispora tengchongensis]|uniref:Putative ABC transport system ATP-binding protein n=1 Tax=Thermocatellispora tengchongensis TaxID=1073253 RepID=A0A840PJZ7_9ACTN|nr:ABC transporter ATP-binding protein [Thermocatellispora tengchongensis]MBB5136375.1 putative ABC transport system ATP-binding protein [Thermocatellispora tengchongensis]
MSEGVVLYGRGLVKRFGATVALGGVDLDVRRAEAVAIMGPSGSGKSTLLHCLAGIMKPDAGEVVLQGGRIDGMRERDRSALRRTRFGFVFQFGQLLPELPAEENVALPLMLGGTPRREAVARAREWFGPLGLAGMEGRRPGELSGGQAQRVAIARALVTGPAVVFADEPTGALDRTTGHATMRLLVEATGHNGASLVVVTHDPEVAAACDRVVEVRDGFVVAAGGQHGGFHAGQQAVQQFGQQFGQQAGLHAGQQAGLHGGFHAGAGPVMGASGGAGGVGGGPVEGRAW